MKVRFAGPDLARLEADAEFTGGYAAEAIRGFRKVMQLIRAAVDERDLHAMRSLNFEKLTAGGPSRPELAQTQQAVENDRYR